MLGKLLLGGIGATFGAKHIYNKLKDGMKESTPFANASLQTQTQGYGKRGMNANTMNTNGLVQSLHGNRRR